MSNKIFFLNPPFFKRFSRESRSPAVTKSDTLYYPKWLCHAAAYAEKCGYDIHVLDAPADEVSLDDTLKIINDHQPFMVVCDTSTPSCLNDYAVANRIMDEFDIPVLLVGRHVSAMPEHGLENSNSEFVALREYEFTVEQVAEYYLGKRDKRHIKGVAYIDKNKEVKRSQPQEVPKDLDVLPWVSPIYKRFLNTDKYFYGHSLHPLVVFDTSRGCPYHCSFCVYPQTFSGHVVRFRSEADVTAEFRWVRENMPEVQTVMLEDDTFIVNKRRTERLADALIADGNTLPYDSNNRVDIGVDFNFLKKLQMSGARLFCVGFESGATDVISHMDKNNNKKKDTTYLETAKEFTHLANKAGIMVHGCFMIGNLNETKETLEQTLSFSKQLEVDTAQFFPIMVYPGTTAYAEAEDRGLLRSTNFNDWLTETGLHDSVVDLPNLSAEDLVKFADRARREFYLRPKYIWLKFKQSLRSSEEFKRNLKGFKKLSYYLLRGSDV